MRIERHLGVLLLLVSSVAAGACDPPPADMDGGLQTPDADGAAPTVDGGPALPQSGVRVALGSVPYGVVTDAFLSLDRCSGGGLCETLATDRAEAIIGGVLVAEPGEAPFDVTVHLPDDAAWAPGDPYGPGYYALATGVDDEDALLWVNQWEHRASRAEVAGRAVVPDGEEAPAGRIGGAITLTDPNVGPFPVVGATVYVERQAVAISGADGAYLLGPVPPGPTTVHVAMPGIASHSVEVEVLPTGVTPLDIDLPPVAAPPDEQFVGLVIDHDTEEPLAGVTVQVHDQQTVTGADGRFEITVPGGAVQAALNLEGYANLRAFLHTCFNEPDGASRFELQRLPEAFFGTWSYCYSERGGERFTPMVVGGEALDPVVDQVWEFGSDGLYDDTAFGARALGQYPKVSWDMIEQTYLLGERYHLVRVVDSTQCGPQHTSAVAIYSHLELEAEHVVYVRTSAFGESRHHFVQGDPETNPDCPELDRPSGPTLGEILEALAGTHPIYVQQAGSCSGCSGIRCFGAPPPGGVDPTSCGCEGTNGVSCGETSDLVVDPDARTLSFGGITVTVPAGLRTAGVTLGRSGFERLTPPGREIWRINVFTQDVEARDFVVERQDGGGADPEYGVRIVFRDDAINPTELRWIHAETL